MGTHKILVNGTAFAVTAGTELINGTICKTRGGRTLVNGTEFRVKFEESLTWKINTEIDRTTDLWENVTFYSDGKTYMRFVTMLSEPFMYIRYYISNYAYETVYSNKWLTGYTESRTITFAEAPTGKLLTWLQANAVQQ